jgi:hypothetical protein
MNWRPLLKAPGLVSFVFERCWTPTCSIAAQRKTGVGRFVKQRHRFLSPRLLLRSDVYRHQRNAFATVEPGDAKQAHRPAANPAVLRGSRLTFRLRGNTRRASAGQEGFCCRDNLLS